MTEISTSEKNPGKKMMKWGMFFLAPLVGLVIIFFGWTLLNLVNNFLSGVAETNPEDPIEAIVIFIKGILTLFGFLCTIWGLSLSPVGLVLLIVGYFKKKKNTPTL